MIGITNPNVFKNLSCNGGKVTFTLNAVEGREILDEMETCSDIEYSCMNIDNKTILEIAFDFTPENRFNVLYKDEGSQAPCLKMHILRAHVIEAEYTFEIEIENPLDLLEPESIYPTDHKFICMVLGPTYVRKDNWYYCRVNDLHTVETVKVKPSGYQKVNNEVEPYFSTYYKQSSIRKTPQEAMVALIADIATQA